MKRLLVAAIFTVAAFFFSNTATAQSSVTSVFNGVTANATSDILACGTRCDGRVWSEEGASGAIITFYCRISSSDSEPWYPCASVTNPGSPGSYISLANSRDYQVKIESWSSGTIHVKFFNSSQH